MRSITAGSVIAATMFSSWPHRGQMPESTRIVLALPRGWRCRVTERAEELELQATGGATVIQDDLANT